ncbi:peptidoglycan/LPS O-acetylase OafA/YrhL [Rhizobium lusitanum]|uniref:Peptidoglycan/LPS O-acetylase OafA/YrhL n=1 Tax=Rhizobium lusitanum TaxID=293958 RepID=A0A7X0IV44_9HYPH|nr:peptidoglycan/LPS O-acetylase OafA/YrhL [Rhizobium lusitanum]
MKRSSRVYPTLLVFVAVTSIALSQTPLNPGIIGVLSALTFTLNYVIIESRSFISVFDHIWSLCVEEHSYLLLGVVALVLRHAAMRSAGIVIFVLGLAAIANGIVQYDILDRDRFTVFWSTDVAAASIMISAAAVFYCSCEGPDVAASRFGLGNLVRGHQLLSDRTAGSLAIEWMDWKRQGPKRYYGNGLIQPRNNSHTAYLDAV